MKVKKVATRAENTENESASADSSEMDKQRLKSEILELQTMISRVEEQNTDITKFSELASAETTLPTGREIRKPTRLPDLDVLFRREIYTYVGLYCVKSTKNEYVFNFAASENGDETFSVQIWNRDGEVALGNWVMPMSVDMKKIHDKTPIESLAMVIPFLKNCKQQVDCYRERKSQFDALKDHISDTSNCEIDANLGFTLIKLRLLGVYSKPKDSYVDLTIDLSYKSNETRPCAIAVDWSLKKDPSQQQENEMKSYAKILKNQRLLDGFRHMTETTHAVYDWAMEEYVNSLLELNNSSGSDEEAEGLLLISAKRKRSKLTVRRRKDRELKDRWRKRQRLTTIVTRSPDRNSTDEENEDPAIENRSSGKTRTSSAVVHSVDLPRSPEEPNEPPQTSQSPKSTAEKNTKSKSGRELRQTTINFRGEKTKASSGEKSEATSGEKSKASSGEKTKATSGEKSKASSGEKTKASSGEKSANDATEKPTEVEETRPRSRKAKTKAAKKNPVGKRGKKSEPKAATLVAEKSVLRKSKPVGILSAVKSGTINRAASTPLQKQVRSKVKFAPIGDVAISPIASADEN